MRTILSACSAILFVASAPAMGAEASVPTELRNWVPWALEGHEPVLCSVAPAGTERICAWPGVLELDLAGPRAKFQMHWDVMGGPQDVPLPGSERAWPSAVKDGTKVALMGALSASQPSVHLTPGRHILKGEIVPEAPGSLRVPQEIGVVVVRDRGHLVSVRRDDDGVARWGADESAAQDDRFSVRVFRKFRDGIPGELSTRVVLDVSGKAREVLLGRALSAEFSPTRLESDLPAALDAEGRLRVQVRPGTHQVTLTAASRAPLSTLSRPKSEGHWPSEEVWSFEGVPTHRVVVVAGGSAVDPAQQDVPAEWRNHSAYPFPDGATLTLSVLPSDAQVGTQWGLRRRIWQDLDGAGFTFEDSLNGEVAAPERLALAAPLSLKELRIEGRPEWLVMAPEASVRVVPREGQTHVLGVGRLERAALSLPASGWEARVQNASTSLYLRPGSTVFHVGGVDQVSDTWVKKWDLMRAFLLTIVCAAASRLHGRRAALLVGAASVLLLPESPELVGFALATVVLSWMVAALGERTHVLVRALRGSHLTLAVCMVFTLIVVSSQELRHALHPTLGEHTMSFDAENFAPLGMAQVQDQGAAEATNVEAKSVQTAEAPAVAPAAPAHPAEKALELTAIAGRASSATPRSAPSKAGWQDYKYSQDPTAVVQAGPGLPAWQGSALTFGWNGSVGAERQARVFAVGPLGTSVFGLLKIVALGILGLWIFPRAWMSSVPELLRKRSFGLLPWVALVAVALLPRTAHADIPSKEVIDELRERITAATAKAHADTEEVLLSVRGNSLIVRMRVHATGETSVALPRVAGWTPGRILLDGKPSSAKKVVGTPDAVGESGLLSPVGLGVHDLSYEGDFASTATQLEIGFGAVRPHRVVLDATGWAADGVDASGRSEASVRLTRALAQTADGKAAIATGAEWPVFRVSRTLTMGLTWILSTEVSRLSPGPAVRLKIPAFPGETPLSAEGVQLERGDVSVTVPASGAVQWNSLIPPGPGTLRLHAAHEVLAFETWKFVPAPQWELQAQGLLATRGQKDAPYTYMPWPGQSLELQVRALLGAAGASLSIESSELAAAPGPSGTDYVLKLALRTTRGSTHMLELPDGADAVQVSREGDSAASQTSSSVSGRKVHLVLGPGKSAYTLTFRTPEPWAVRWTAPSVDLGAPSTNHRLKLTEVGQRWVLGAWGDGLAPIVLLAGILIGVAGLAWLLARFRAVPLSAPQWALLLLGLVTSSAWGMAIVIAWFVATSKLPYLHAWPSVWKKRLGYVAYAVLSLAMIGNCMDCLSKTFTGYPESYIEGPGCSARELVWYVDRVGAHISGRATLLSLPIWVYRLAMFAWALSVARLVLTWSKWVWSCVLPKEATASSESATRGVE